jgi:hypothetical protein
MELKPLDFYCERTDAQFWSEPWNAWSNMGFILVGLWALWKWLRLRKQNPLQTRPRPLVLSCLLVLVGIGSFGFHTYADNLTYLGDLLPIFIFTSVYLYHSARRYLSYSTLRSSLLLVACIAGMVLIELKVPKSILNGSTLYLPPLALLFFFATAMRNLAEPKWSRWYLTAASIFLASLVFRTMDQSICEQFAHGTHFIWHLLNSVCLGVLLLIAIEFDRENIRKL